MATAAAVIIARERHIVDAFVRAGVTSPDRARTPEELGVDASGLAWLRLRDRAVGRESPPGSGRYYVDAEVWQALRRTRHRIAVVLLVVALVLVVVLTMATTAGAH